MISAPRSRGYIPVHVVLPLQPRTSVTPPMFALVLLRVRIPAELDASIGWQNLNTIEQLLLPSVIGFLQRVIVVVSVWVFRVYIHNFK